MSAEFTDENLVEAFCKTVACTGLGAFETFGKEHFDENVLKAIPENLHKDYPEKLLFCTVSICSDKPFSWEVDQRPPSLSEQSTFGELFDNWFKSILSEA